MVSGSSEESEDWSCSFLGLGWLNFHPSIGDSFDALFRVSQV